MMHQPAIDPTRPARPALRTALAVVLAALVAPPATAEPIVAGMTTEVYGQFPANPAYGPWGLSVAADGTLYAGAMNNTLDGVHLRLIPPGGGDSVLFSDTALYDPDDVLVDAGGDIGGVPGGLLVACGDPADLGLGLVRLVRPDGSVQNLTDTLPALANVGELASDSSATLYAAVFGQRTIVRFEGAAPVVLATLPGAATPGRMDFDDQDRLWIEASDQVVRRYSLAGALEASVPMDGPPNGLAWAGCGTLAGAMHTVVGDELVRIEPGGATATVGTGFTDILSMDFSASGDLFAADFETGVVYRLSGAPSCPCNAADLATPFGVLNFFDVQAFLNLFAASDPAADFADDGVIDFFDIQAFLQAFSAGCP